MEKYISPPCDFLKFSICVIHEEPYVVYRVKGYNPHIRTHFLITSDRKELPSLKGFYILDTA